MIALTIYIILVAAYFLFRISSTTPREAGLAIIIFGLYIVLYLFVPPFSPMNTIHLGRLYEFVPTLALGTILFPNFNTQSPEIVTRILGWIGLIGVAVILCIFKLFIW